MKYKLGLAVIVISLVALTFQLSQEVPAPTKEVAKPYNVTQAAQ